MCTWDVLGSVCPACLTQVQPRGGQTYTVWMPTSWLHVFTNVSKDVCGKLAGCFYMSVKTAFVSLRRNLALRYKGSVRDCRCCIIWNKREIRVTELNKNTHQGNSSSLGKQGELYYAVGQSGDVADVGNQLLAGSYYKEY